MKHSTVIRLVDRSRSTYQRQLQADHYISTESVQFSERALVLAFISRTLCVRAKICRRSGHPTGSFCLMVACLFLTLKRYPFSLICREKTPPILAKNENFYCKKNHPFFAISRREHCVMTPFKTNRGLSLQL